MKPTEKIYRWTGSPLFRVSATLALLAFGLIDLPLSWGKVRVMKHAMKSPEIGRESAGYYEGLIGASDEESNALKQSLVGEPTDWVHFNDSGVSQMQTDDLLLFRLAPNVSRSLFGKPFTTNALRMRDRPVTLEKPDNVIRIALLGASMDMGWGVSTEETYENLLEDWLNAHAERRGDKRRFEILNFAVAAYSPTQRLDSYRRFARKLKPDMVLYATTMLDPRLTEIHLCDLMNYKTDFRRYVHLTDVVAQSGFDPAALRRDARGKWLDKNVFKKWLEPRRDAINHAVLGELVRDTQSDGIKLVCLIIPRAGRNDLPHLREEGVAIQKASAASYKVPLWDLSVSFDDDDPTKLALASWDDHPNAKGHELIFRTLAKRIQDDPIRDFFGLKETAADPAQIGQD